MVPRSLSDYHAGMPPNHLPPWAPTDEKLRLAVERLVACARPKRIILFGSRARGDAAATSDVDLMVVKDRVSDRHGELVELDRSLAGITMPVDIVLVSEDEFAVRAAQPGTVERAASRDGRVLYAA